jgi:glycosyltransferase involved in cell wall biosynthesis
LKHRVRELGIERRVSFKGHVDDAYKYMKAFDVFVFPSGPMEAFGLVLLEAMLARVPVVSCDAPGPLEVVGDAALIFRTGDAGDLREKLVQAYRMPPAELRRLSEAGLQRVLRDYTLDAFRRRIWRIPPLEALSSGDR